MSFEEKIDAMRVTLELARKDNEAELAAIRALRIASASQYQRIQVLGTAAEALLKNAGHEGRQ